MRVTTVLLCLASAAVSSSAAPVITLNLVDAKISPNIAHAGKYGLGCEKDPLLCRTATYESKSIHICAAGSSTAETCPLPEAKAYDHTDGDLSKSVGSKTYLVNNNGAPVKAAPVCVDKNCIDYSKRSEWITMFDVNDKSGNAADTVIFATVLNDHAAPVLTPKGPFRAEATPTGTVKIPVASANDNIDMAVPVLTIPASVALNKLATTRAVWKACDTASMFGSGGRNNCVSKEFNFVVSDTTKPVITTIRASDMIECARGKKADPHLHSRFGPKCLDSFDGVLACTTKQDIHHPLSEKGTTSFSWNAVDKSGNKATKVSRVTVVDTTPPTLLISDAGRKNLKRDQNGKYVLQVKGKPVAFSRAVLRDMGYDWGNSAMFTHRMGDKLEAEMVAELLTPNRGFRCSDGCGKASATATVHQNLKAHHIALACGATNGGNKVRIFPHRPLPAPSSAHTVLFPPASYTVLSLRPLFCRHLSSSPRVFSSLVPVLWSYSPSLPLSPPCASLYASLALTTHLGTLCFPPTPLELHPYCMQVTYDHLRKGTYTLRYTCTDEMGFKVIACRTIQNVHVGRVALNVFIAVPAKINTMDIRDAMLTFFRAPKMIKYGIKPQNIIAKMGKLVPAPAPAPADSRRLIEAIGARKKVARFTPAPAPAPTEEADMFRQDIFKINIPHKKLAEVYKVLLGCEYEVHLQTELQLKCRLVNPLPTFKCLEVKEIVLDEVSPATPLLVVRGETQIAVEALSKYEDAGAYCIRPCKEHEDIMLCPGRLPLGNSIMKLKPKNICDPNLNREAEVSKTDDAAAEVIYSRVDSSWAIIILAPSSYSSRHSSFVHLTSCLRTFLLHTCTSTYRLLSSSPPPAPSNFAPSSSPRQVQ
jgi:hypothetical protein